ncbi:aspartyl protease family protein [Rhodobacter aestuarii]|uniref:Aspartyl protease family protein n=1 Tax=Rhodobacter aestuarii TaxID=453582 RepID=A0A1N7NMT7_9RHOB|nr:TIGR02281 family clan AA aspartic protease [Rhodobacter aestuarii]PTV94670.1 aspartyl protease family protein [Rhodobacter aestuarii]SIS99695.1 aspartyl protease family protein [Rhodobacter aestuarii]
MIDDPERLVYLVLLLLVLAGSVIAKLRHRPGETVQQMMIWALIFLGVVAVAGLWPEFERTLLNRQAVHQDGRIETPVAMDGHYYLTAEVNGTPIRFVVDTGASSIVLSRADAARVGLDTGSLAYIGQAQTANGTVATAPVRLDSVAIGPFSDSNVRAVVNRGELTDSLLGMSYLTRFAKVEFDGNRMILTR